MSTPPTNYDRQYNFEDYQTLNPTAPLPGQEIEAELNNIELSVNQTISRLNELQNSDGSLKISSSLSAQTVALATTTATAVAETATEAYLTANYDPTIAAQAATSASAANASMVIAQSSEHLASLHAGYAEQATLSAQNYSSQASTARTQARDYAIDANDSRNEALASEQAAATHLADTATVYISALQLKSNVDSQSNKFLNKREEMHHASANMLFNGGDISSDMISKVFSGTSFNSNSQLQNSGTVDSEYANRENGLWWVQGHPEPEHPALIISRDMGVVLANTWKVFGSNAVTGGMKNNQAGINGCPSSNWHLNDYQIHPLIQSVNFSQTGYGIDRIYHQLAMQRSALTPVAYVNGEDDKVREEITALANDSNNRFLHVTGGTVTGSVTFDDGASGFQVLIGSNGLSFTGIAYEQGIVVDESRIVGFNIELPPASSGNSQITFGDGTVQTTATLVGPAGSNGINGINGINGTNGANGTIWTYRGNYDNGVVYAANDYVDLDGSSYVMINTIGGGGYGPISHPYAWQLVAHKGDTGLQGNQGPAGSDANHIGPQGPQGDQGDQGPQGNDGGSFSDVSNDGTPYIRINSSWQPLSSYDQSGGGISDAPADGNAYVRVNSGWSYLSTYDQNSGGGGGIGEAPYDGQAWVRVNNDWQPFSNYDQNSGMTGPEGPAGADGSSGIGNPPYDSQAYIRINDNWELLSNYDQTGIGEAPHDSTPYVRINSGWAQAFSGLQGNTETAGYITPHYPYEVRITVNGTDYWMPVRQA